MAGTFASVIQKQDIMDANEFQKGILYINGECVNIENLQWHEHPSFKGVFLKHIIKGEKTDYQLSCHFVRINAGCAIGLHNHPEQTELHEIIEGFGECIIEQEKINYQKGVTGFSLPIKII